MASKPRLGEKANDGSEFMKLLFLILAHNQPGQVAELAKALVQSAEDGTALIHFDAGADDKHFHQLEELVSENDAIRLAKERIRCKWGDYSLVQAVIDCLSELIGNGESFDYVLLLSGTCLPNRPIRQLERYLRENYGKEFIENADPAWVVDGLRSERFELYFPFAARPESYFERLWTKSQKMLRIKRTVPNGLSPKFGSQWWALTWETCSAIVTYLQKNENVTKFFKSTYIPDEMVFPTMAGEVCDKENISGFGLTTYMFMENGKPAIFYDDHYEMAKRLNRFFFRKVSHKADRLRKEFLKVASLPDDGSALDKIGTPNSEYMMTLTAQTHFPVPGQIFYRDNCADMPEGVLRNIRDPYIVVFGEDARIRQIMSGMRSDSISTFGRLFAPDRVRLDHEGEEFSTLGLTSPPVRDIHPALFLARVRTRVNGIMAFGWAPGDSAVICNIVAHDPKAFCVLSLHNDAALFGPNGLFPLSSFGSPTASDALRAFEIVTGIAAEIPEDRFLVDRLSQEGLGLAEHPSRYWSRFSHSSWFQSVTDAADRDSPEPKRASRELTQ